MAILIFILGLIVGSFLNVVINRLHSNRSIIWGRSKCQDCQRELTAWDLVPLASFIFLSGKCRYCGKKISWQYPIVELITAVVFVLLFVSHGAQITDYGFWLQTIFACFLIVIAVYDYKHYLILDKVVLPFCILALALALLQNNFFWAMGGALIISGFFALQYFISRGRWIGFGDVKLGVFLGLLFGKLSLAYLLFSYILGGILGIGLMLFAKKEFKSRVPFGTILATCAIIFMLYGDFLVGAYLGIFKP